MKIGTSTKAVYGFAVFAAAFITLSGLLSDFGDGLVWAYVAVGALVAVVTVYNIVAGKK